jgi:hypothetical protein
MVISAFIKHLNIHVLSSGINIKQYAVASDPYRKQYRRQFFLLASHVEGTTEKKFSCFYSS